MEHPVLFALDAAAFICLFALYFLCAYRFGKQSEEVDS